MNILQLISGGGLNGAIRHCCELTRLLAERGHRVVLAHKPGVWIGQQEYPANVERLETSLKRTPSELRRMADALRSHEIDVVHTHLSSAHFFGVLLARLFGFRSVATSHMTFFQPHWWWNDRVIAPSQRTARFQRWVNAVPSRRIDVIPNFIDTQRFKPKMERQAMRCKLGILPDEFVITVVGEVNERKAQHVLVQAVPEMARQGIRPRILLVGYVQDGYRETVERAISSCEAGGVVTMLGMRDDVADLLHASDCCCLPSNREVMPISLLEAMCLGLPAVGTRVGGVPECIRDGIDGYIVPPRDPKKLAEALVRLAKDPQLRAEMGASARRNMLEAFSPEACLPKIEATYQLAVGRGRQAA